MCFASLLSHLGLGLQCEFTTLPANHFVRATQKLQVLRTHRQYQPPVTAKNTRLCVVLAELEMIDFEQAFGPARAGK